MSDRGQLCLVSRFLLLILCNVKPLQSTTVGSHRAVIEPLKNLVGILPWRGGTEIRQDCLRQGSPCALGQPAHHCCVSLASLCYRATQRHLSLTGPSDNSDWKRHQEGSRAGSAEIRPGCSGLYPGILPEILFSCVTKK